MKPICFDNPHAFKPLTEPVKWTQDKSPHRTGVFGAVVTQGNVAAQSAGPTAGPVAGDVWTVHVPNSTALVADVREGDTLARVGIGAEVLTVQQIAKCDSGWWLTCTANERSPL